MGGAKATISRRRSGSHLSELQEIFHLPTLSAYLSICLKFPPLPLPRRVARDGAVWYSTQADLQTAWYSPWWNARIPARSHQSHAGEQCARRPLKRQVGHRTLQTTSGYTHFSPEIIRDNVKRLGGSCEAQSDKYPS